MENMYYVKGNNSCGIAYSRKDAEIWLRLAAFGASAQGDLVFSSGTQDLDAIVPFPIKEVDNGDNNPPDLVIEGDLATEGQFSYSAKWVPGMTVTGRGRKPVFISWPVVDRTLASGVWHPTTSGFTSGDGKIRLSYAI